MIERASLEGTAQLRWELADAPAHQGELFGRPRREVGRGEYRGLEFLHVEARRIINEIKGDPFLPFRFTVNPYRGCSHACTYCFARPTHEYLGLGIGTDFDQRIVVKINAVERLRAELKPSRWRGEPIALGTNTDPYQRCEGKYRLTRGIIRTLIDAGNPFSILTKSTLVLRDLDLLQEAAAVGRVRVNLSIGTLDHHAWKTTEPGTPAPERRLRAVAQLNEAGVPCGVLVAPVIPGLTDGPAQLRAVAQACVDAGAVSVSTVMLHLRPGVRDHFLGALHRSDPTLAHELAARYRGAYGPKADRRRIGDQVHRTIAAAGGLAVDRFADGHLAPPVETPVAAPTRPAPPADQLSLPLPT